MQKIYSVLTSFFTFIVLLSISNAAAAQCTLTIPAVSTTNNYDYCGSTAYTASKTTEAYYGPHYTWVCSGDTVDFITDTVINKGNQQCCGTVILEPGAVFILEYGAAGWAVFAKAGSSFINRTNNVNGNNTVVSEPGAFITPGFSNGLYDQTNYCTPVTNTSCSQLIYDYSLIVPGTGCNVSTKPTAQFTSNTSQICAGDSITFTDQSTGSPTSWNWTFTGGTPSTSTAQNPTVVYNGSGTFDAKLVTANTGGTDSTTKTAYVSVNSNPVAGTIISPEAICAGNTTQLSDTGSTGTVQWQMSITGNDFSDINNADVAGYTTPSLTQNTYYRLVANNGMCADTSAPVMVTVNPLPDPPAISTADSLICTSDSAYIQASGPFTSYTWNTNTTGDHIYTNTAGDYYVTATDANGCTVVSAHQQISVYPVPSVSILVRGDTLTSFGSVSYQWLLNGTPVSNATGQLYVVSQQGDYSVQVVDTNGCAAVSSAVTVTGISELAEDAQVLLYPNPNSTSSVGLTVSNKLLGSKIEVYDDNGRIVFQSEVHNLKSELDINIAKGIYWLRISSGNASVIKKLIKL